MVLKPDGSKYACQPCLKGHRVSTCTHVERELFFVPKKGRPVTQCHHCRQERKKRSAHVKCDCGEVEKPHHPREKCIHLREAEERAKAGFHDDHAADKDPSYLAAVAEEQGCCCHHGGKCTCSLLKKESPSDGSAPHGPAVKPRLEKTNSDSSITVFSNGHHKPIHRKNHAAHESGMPYKMPMPRSHTDQAVPTTSRRSIDNLGSDGANAYLPSSFPSTTKGSFNAAYQSSGPEQQSSAEAHMGRTSLPDPQFTGFGNLTRTMTNQSRQSTTSDAPSYAAFEPMSGATEGSFDPWSAFPSTESMTIPDNNAFGGWTLNEHFNMVQPALTAGSSGTQSEIDEIPPSDDFFSFGMPSIQEDVGSINATASGNSPQWNRRSLPPGFFGNVDFALAAGANNEWQASTGPDSTDMDKYRSDTTAGFPDFDEAYQMSNMALTTGISNRPIAALASTGGTGRPQSHSVGPSNAPSDDIIRQLFPDFDLDGNSAGSSSNTSTVFGSGVTGSPQQLPTSDKLLSVTSAPAMDLSLLNDADLGGENDADASAGFTSRTWDDGSLSMPNDTYSPSSYDLNPNFSTPDLDAAWAEQ